MSDIKTVLQPAVVSCPSPLPSAAAHKCEFTLNIGIFMDGSNNNKASDENKSANTNVVRLWEAYRDARHEGFLRTWARRIATFVAVLFTAVLVTACQWMGGANSPMDHNKPAPAKDMIGVSVAGVGHLGSMYGIPEFSVNGQWGGNAPGWGGGGGGMCCVRLPAKTVEPVVVHVAWQTCDATGIKFVNDRAVDPNARCKLDAHEANVPIHFAVEPGDSSGLNVHFLPGNRVELWMARGYPWGSKYPGPKYPSGPAPAYAPLPDEKPMPSTSGLQRQ